MRKYVNLMSEGAQFRTAARVQLRRWVTALVATTVVLTPIAIGRWQEARRVRQDHEALEASYDPIRRLTSMNNELRTTAATLVRDDRLPLELSRKRPVGTLLGIVSAAAAASNGELYVEHLQLAQSPPSQPGAPPAQDRLIIDVASTLTFDIANFVEALKVAPIAEVKVASDELVEENGIDRKNYSLECLLSTPASGKAAHVN
jgi:hypothetical protein